MINVRSLAPAWSLFLEWVLKRQRHDVGDTEKSGGPLERRCDAVVDPAYGVDDNLSIASCSGDTRGPAKSKMAELALNHITCYCLSPCGVLHADDLEIYC